MAYIGEQLKYNGGYVDGLMSVTTVSELNSVPGGDRFLGLTVNVKKVYGNLSADFWLVNGKADRNWKLKNAPVFTSTVQRDEFTTACLNMIPKGFIVTVSDNNETEKYYYDGTTWQPYGGVEIDGEDSGTTL